MNKFLVHFAIITRTVIAIVVAFTGGAIAQSSSGAANKATAAPSATSLQTVAIDPTKNAVRIANTSAEAVPVKTVTNRTPYQVRTSVAPTNTAFVSSTIPIPAGKRFTIENISGVGYCPEGIRMEVVFFTYLDNNGDGVNDGTDITFHRVVLTDQGTFDGTAISAADHKVLIFADERIGTSHFGVTLMARINATTTAFTQAQVTFSGYLEDLP